MYRICKYRYVYVKLLNHDLSDQFAGDHFTGDQLTAVIY